MMKDLIKSIERLCRSGKIQLGSKAEEIIVLGGLRKKYSTRCQILRSKDYLHTQLIEGLIQINWAPMWEWENPSRF